MVPIFEKGVNMEGSGTNQHMFRREYFGKSLSTLCGGFLVVLTIAIGCFLLAKGMLSFTQFHHSVSEFLLSGLETDGYRSRRWTDRCGDLHLGLYPDLRGRTGHCHSF